jgi:hypothetical protein
MIIYSVGFTDVEAARLDKVCYEADMTAKEFIRHAVKVVLAMREESGKTIAEPFGEPEVHNG